MEKFRIKGLDHPGRVNLLRVGTIDLAFISDELAEQLWNDGCIYLEPVPLARSEYFPDETPITVEEIKFSKPAPAQVSQKKKNVHK